jgi:hypothetical protein
MLYFTNTPLCKQFLWHIPLVTKENLPAAKEVINSCGTKIEGIARIRRKYK